MATRTAAPKSAPRAASAQPALGAALRALRRERGNSLAEVAREAAISQSFLSLVETGQTDITLSRLMRLVTFYGVSIAELLPDPPHLDPLVVRKGEERHVYSPAEGIDVSLLWPDAKGTMMPMLVTFEPGGAVAEDASHEGEEFVHVLRGRIEVDVEGSPHHVLRQGDSIYFRADRRHAYRNAGRSRAILFTVVTPPVGLAPEGASGRRPRSS